MEEKTFGPKTKSLPEWSQTKFQNLPFAAKTVSSQQVTRVQGTPEARKPVAPRPPPPARLLRLRGSAPGVHLPPPAAVSFPAQRRAGDHEADLVASSNEASRPRGASFAFLVIGRLLLNRDDPLSGAFV